MASLLRQITYVTFRGINRLTFSCPSQTLLREIGDIARKEEWLAQNVEDTAITVPANDIG
jgi:hypothetical protein